MFYLHLNPSSMSLLRSAAALLLVSAFLQLLVSVKAQGDGCDCGYIDPDTNQVWTTYWKRDFTTMSRQDLQNDFNMMGYTVQHGGGDSRDFQPENVDIDGNGLHLTVKPSVGTSVPSAGVYTKR